MESDLRDIFRFCERFEKVTDAASFAAYIARCQIETTMSFNDYYAEVPNLPAWPVTPTKWGAGLSAAALAVGVIVTVLVLLLGLVTTALQSWLPYSVALSLIGLVVLIIAVFLAYKSIMAFGAKPFPAAPDSDLPSVLKALHMQRVFTRFAIDSQMEAVGKDAASAQKLYDDFAAFVAANKPYEVGAPTQPPGVIGI
jgi:hypothetical protein